jgi:transposase
MKKSNKFSPDVRERAVRMVQEHRAEYPSLSAPFNPLLARTAACRRPCMNGRARRVDAGARAGIQTGDLHA